jgi:hypothetical protein
MYMLAGGLALVIPAVVLTLNATRYQPEEGATEDRTPGPMAEPGAPGSNSITGTPSGAPAPPPPPPAAVPAPPAPPPPQSLLDVHHGAFRLGVPALAVTPAFTVACGTIPPSFACLSCTSRFDRPRAPRALIPLR